MGLIVLLGATLTIIAIKRKRTGLSIKTNYRNLFFIGAAIICICASPSLFMCEPGLYGITINREDIALKQFSNFSGMHAIVTLGIVYMLAGIIHRDKFENKAGEK